MKKRYTVTISSEFLETGEQDLTKRCEDFDMDEYNDVNAFGTVLRQAIEDHCGELSQKVKEFIVSNEALM